MGEKLMCEIEGGKRWRKQIEKERYRVIERPN